MAPFDIKTQPPLDIDFSRLSAGDRMTLRAALNNFIMDLNADGLGEDAHGVYMTEAYLARAKRMLETLDRTVSL